MVKKLYTMKGVSGEFEDGRVQHFGDQTSELGLTSQQNDVLQSILKRKKIKYGYF